LIHCTSSISGRKELPEQEVVQEICQLKRREKRDYKK
jgi:hypothetical protein